MNTVAPMSAANRVVPHLAHAFGGVWRLTLRRYLLPVHWITVVGLCGLLVLTSFPAASTAPQAKTGFMPWVITFYLTFLLPLLAYIAAGGAIRDEMKAGNVDYVFTRPVGRSAFLGCKYASHLACIQLDCLISFATVMGIGIYREVPGLAAAAPALFGAQVLVLAAFTALGFLGGISSHRYIVYGLVYGAVIEIGVGQIPTQISQLSMTHQVRAMLQPLVPSEAAAAAAGAVSAPPSVFLTVLLVLGFTGLCFGAAAALFSLLELSGPNEA